jgi:DNA (cytosine-5)-methyltransferase 1
MKSGALFAGYGGLDLAVEEVFGATPAWVSEIEPAPSQILATRFPSVPNLGDITKIDWAAVEPVDIITGGSPCQDLSHAGSRAGMNAGTRSGLWASMCDAIAIIRPQFVVWENVRGALSATATAGDVETCDLCVGDAGDVHLRALGRVLGDLAELGYDAAWHGLRAADVGAPHGRFRVFVLAWLADTSSDTGGVRDGDGSAVADAGRLRGDTGRVTAPGEAEGRRTQPVPGLGRGVDAVALLPTPAAQEPGGTAEQYHAQLAAHDGRESTFLPLSMAVQESRAFGQYAPAIARWGSILGRPAPAPTEPTGRDGAHRLSPRFVEWLMGLDDGWVTAVGLTRNEQLKALGNGVVPAQAAAALRHLLSIRAEAVAHEGL